MPSPSAFKILAILLVVIPTTYTLECYVCSNQEDNDEKCLKSIKTCEPHEDVCLSEIKWGSTPYWSQGAIKQYYVSKKCSTKDKCNKYRNSNMPLCTHLWYQDWKCSECCKGDRCNYYVISGSTSVHLNYPIVLGSIFTITYLKYIL